MPAPVSRRPVRFLSLVRRPAATARLRSFRPALDPLESRLVPYAITEISIPLASSNPLFMTAAPDGNLWFTQRGTAQMAGTFGGTIGRVTPGGKITQFALGTPYNRPLDIAAGAGGDVWFTEAFYDIYAYDRVARLSGGAVVEYFPPSARYGNLGGIAVAADGSAWFCIATADGQSGKIGHATTADTTVTEFSLPVSPRRITAGPDGALWFTYQGLGGPDGIGRISTGGSSSYFPLPGYGSSPFDITTGPDGALWFTEEAAGRVGRITTAGVLTEFTVSSYLAAPTAIRAGADGDLYVSFAQSGNAILRLSTAGAVVRSYPVPSTNASPLGLALGPDNQVWFAENGANKLGRLSGEEITQRFAGSTADFGLSQCASNYG